MNRSGFSWSCRNRTRFSRWSFGSRGGSKSVSAPRSPVTATIATSAAESMIDFGMIGPQSGKVHDVAASNGYVPFPRTLLYQPGAWVQCGGDFPQSRTIDARVAATHRPPHSDGRHSDSRRLYISHVGAKC